MPLLDRPDHVRPASPTHAVRQRHDRRGRDSLSDAGNPRERAVFFFAFFVDGRLGFDRLG